MGETDTTWYNCAYADGTGASAERKMLRKVHILREDIWSIVFQLSTGAVVRVAKTAISYISEWTGDERR